jgi:superfamily I DNA and/or RNA helicase
MSYKKCPICELNYIQETALMCDVCANEQNDLSKQKKIYNKYTNISIESFADTERFYNKYIDEITKEINFLKSNEGLKNLLYDGSFIGQRNGRYYYTFETDTEVYYQDNTVVALYDNNFGKISGEIVSCDGNTIVICLINKLSSVSLQSIYYSVDSLYLLTSLIERLNGMKMSSLSPIVDELIYSKNSNIEYGKPIATGYDKAVYMAKNQPITFIWGPPGTGKTQTLSNIALNEIKSGHRVLIVSYSNISVDGAVKRIYSLNKNMTAGEMVRYGYPRDIEILSHEFLSSYNLVLHNNPRLLNKRDELIKAQSKLKQNDLQYIEIQKRLTAIKEQLSIIEKEAVRNAKIVATTISKAIVDKTIYDGKFDTVIFDEASMAYIPQIFFAASLARKHFICVGDFYQLPPIVQSGDDNLLNFDVFRYCKIKKAVDLGANHAWLCMLDIQHRMHPTIASFISERMYSSLLKSGSDTELKTSAIVRSLPIKDFSLSVVDTSGMMTVCKRTIQGSFYNPLSAFMTIGLALNGVLNNEVGIITPYNAQSRLLKAMAKDLAEYNSALKNITCATVHSYQGSEKDIILYDTVDCYRSKYPSVLLTSTVNDYANRLFNVAVTRARGKFSVIGNMDFFKDKKLSSNTLFSKLYNSCYDSERVINCLDLLKREINNTTDIYRLYNTETGNVAFINDINNAHNEISIDIPNCIDKENCNYSRLVKVLNVAKSRGVSILIRAENMENLPNDLKKFAIQNEFVYNPITIIDRQITWFGEPISKAHFVIGGKIEEPIVRPIIRFLGKNTAKSFYRILEIRRDKLNNK